ncbi:MAG TPA: acyl-ACP desaturase [Gemmataceae bacterium]|nr:acyl-ACP desaturase [Gemmataceae bacterium]
MTRSAAIDHPEVRSHVYRAYRDYFDKAERKRRWNVRTDIPWDQCNPGIDPTIADVVQTFCMVELYLPDYLSKQLPQVRDNRGRAWMLANWGYEESKHSMALEDWLVRSGHRTEQQMEQVADGVFEREWQLRYNDPLASVIYTTFQEMATKLHYRNLRAVAGGRCPALDKVLELVMIDEAAHAQFFRQLVSIYLEADREATLEQFRAVANTFTMPADQLLADGRQRVAAVKALKIFDEQVFFNEVFEPLLHQLGLTRADLRRRKIVPAA